MNIEILDCTLRDGGYVNDWQFNDHISSDILEGLSTANIDIIEAGYFAKSTDNVYGTIFSDLNKFSHLQIDHEKLAAMIDVAAVTLEDIPKYNGKGIRKLRVVFYKRQVDQAIIIIRELVEKGYEVFVQPMVTIDYSTEELLELVTKIEANVAAYSIVDSFGNMTQEKIFSLFDSLAEMLKPEVKIGFHSHNNKNSSLLMASSLINHCLNHNVPRTIIIDSSLNGMGRGAGNLETEVICDYVNSLTKSEKYDVKKLSSTAIQCISPFKEKYVWGYDTFYFLTANLGFHPNYVKFIKQVDPLISPNVYISFLESLDDGYKTLCRLETVRELYKEFLKKF